MSFSSSNGVITQTGVDTDLSGLDGLTGVTKTILMPSSGDYQGKVQYTTNNRLVIDGTLSHDPDSEILVLQHNNASRPLTINGTYNYGSSQTFNTGDVYEFGSGLQVLGYLTGTQRQWNPTTAGIYVSSTGVFNWKGTSIFSGRSIISEGQMNIENAYFVPRSTNLTTKNYCPRIAFAGTQVNPGSVDGLTVFGGAGNFFGIAFTASNALSLFTNVNIVGNTNLSSAIAGDLIGTTASYGHPFIYIQNVSNLASGNKYAGRAWQRRMNKWVNYENGVLLKDELSDKSTGDGGSLGAVLAVKKYVAKIFDSTGSPISSAKIYIPEESDGNEPSSAVTALYTDEDISYLQNPVNHQETSDATGACPEVELNLFFGYKQAAFGTMVENVRTKSGENKLDFYAISYSNLIYATEIDTSGIGVNTQSHTMIGDLTISEPDKTIVDDYTEIDTPQKFYDRAKSYLTDNYAGEGATIVARAGNEIDLGSFNLVINKGATSVFAFDGTTITIKASTFVGNLVTTGDITLLNDAEVIGSYTDSSGTISTLSYTITDLVPNSRVQLWNNDTNQEVLNAVVTTIDYTGTYIEGIGISAGDEIRMRVTYQDGTTAYLPYVNTASATASGFSFKANQDADAVYNSNGIDGSTVTTLSADFPNVQVDVNDPDGIADVREIYAKYVAIIYTADGIRNWTGGITAVDNVNYRVNTSIANLTIQNVSTVAVNLAGARIYRDDGQIILAAEDGDKPITQDNGEFVQFIKPQVEASLSTITKNTDLIPALL